MWGLWDMEETLAAPLSGMHACACAGRAGSTSEAPKAGQSVKNAASDVVGSAKSKVDQAAGKSKKFFGLF